MENSMEVHYKTKNRVTIWFSSITHGHISGDKTNYTPTFMAALFTIAKAWKQSKGLWMDQWIKKMWYIYSGVLFSYFPSPGDLPNPGIETRSPTLQENSLPAEPQGKPFRPRIPTIPLRYSLLSAPLYMPYVHENEFVFLSFICLSSAEFTGPSQLT